MMSLFSMFGKVKSLTLCPAPNFNRGFIEMEDWPQALKARKCLPTLKFGEKIYGEK